MNGRQNSPRETEGPWNSTQNPMTSGTSNVMAKPHSSNDNHNDEHDERTPLLLSHNTDGSTNPSAQTHTSPGIDHGPAVTASPLQAQPQQGEQSRGSRKRAYSRLIKILGLLLLLSLLAAVLAPWAAQRVLDRAMVLEIQQADIHDMDHTGFHISLNSTIFLDSANDGFFGVTGLLQYFFRPTVKIQPTTLGLNIPSQDDGLSMAEFDVEEQHMELGQTLQLHISTHVRVKDAKLMADFFGRALRQSTVDLAVSGPVLTRLGHLWYMDLRINRIVALDGLRGVQDATLVSMELPEEHPLGGIVMSGKARINNPSDVISLQMGAVTFGIYLPSKAHPDVDLYKIAEVTSPGLRLRAGKANDLVLAGRLFHLDDWTLTETGQPALRSGGSEKQLLLGELLSRFIQGDNSTIQVRALSKDRNLPAWLSEAFRSIVLEMVFPGSPTKDFMRSLNMDQLEFGFSSDKKSALLSGQMSSVLQLPPNVTFPIKLLKMKPIVSLKAPGGNTIAALEILDFLPTVSRQEGASLEVEMGLENIRLGVVPEQLPDFYHFLNSSFTKDWIHLGIAGDARAVVECGLGTFELGPIPFDVVTSQRGLAGLVSVPPLLQKLDVIDSTEHSLTVKATLVLWNPSNISAVLGDMSFLWSYGGYVVGMATVSEVQLKAGNNTIECFGMMDPSIDCKRKHNPGCETGSAVNASREFISKYISGDNTTTIDVLGYAGSTRVPLLQPMMSKFAITSFLPEIGQEFLISATMYLLSHSLVLELQNPLDTIITVLYVNGTASYKNETLGHVLVDFEHDIASPKPILIPANDHQNETSGYVKTPRLPVVFDLSSVGYEALKKALGGSLEVDVVCHIKAKVGSMLMWVDFVKDGVVANVRKGW